MKDKIIFFIIGLLLGAIISTASIYVYTLASNNKQDFGMNGNNPPNMSNAPQNGISNSPFQEENN